MHVESSGAARPPRIAVIGGGVSGLAAAHRLLELNPSLDVSLFEAAGAVGGVIQTEQRGGFLIERSADMFATGEPWAWDLCRRLGLADQLIETNSAERRAFVLHRGRLRPLPEGFTLVGPSRIWPIVATPLLSLRGKLRLASEYFIPPRQDNEDESLASFAVRRLGREAFERLVQPLISGVYTADPNKLSMRAALPQLVEMERRCGGLLRAARKRRHQGGGPATGARYGMFLTLRDGLASLIRALADRLPAGCVRLNAPVERIEHTGGKWKILVGAGEAIRFDAVIVATPAHRAAKLLEQADAALAAHLDRIPYAGVAIVVLGYQRSQIGHPLDGFGFVAPLVEQRRILAASFSSVKFAGRAPPGSVLLRTFVGGACQPELVELSRPELQSLVRHELEELLSVRGEPIFWDVVRWPQAMPQYHVGHLELVNRIENRAAGLANLTLAGNAYRGVGIPFCIRSGEQAAERVLSRISDRG